MAGYTDVTHEHTGNVGNALPSRSDVQITNKGLQSASLVTKRGYNFILGAQCDIDGLKLMDVKKKSH